MIKLTVDFVGKNKFNKLIRYIQNNLIYGEIQQEIRVLGHHTADNMRQTIQESGYNLNELATKILAETLNTTGGIEVGVGRIETLPFYWELFDRGFTPGSSGNFVPLGSFADGKPESGKSGGKWLVGSGTSTFRDININKKPVEPLDFVNKSIRLLEIEMKDFLKNIGGKFIKNMKTGAKSSFGSRHISAWGTRVTFGPSGSASGGAK